MGENNNLLNVGTNVDLSFDQKAVWNFVIITVVTAVLFWMVQYFMTKTFSK